MKKRTRIYKGVALILAIVICLTVISCGTTPAEDVAVQEITGFKPIPGREDVQYSEETKVIFYIFSTKDSTELGYKGYGYGYMAPYISENGRYCRYIDGKFVEIRKEDVTK